MTPTEQALRDALKAAQAALNHLYNNLSSEGQTGIDINGPVFANADPHIDHALSLPAAEPMTEHSDHVDMSPEFTDTARAALLWVLWHHQGGSSPVGQPIRYVLGMGANEHLNAHQVNEAKRWASIAGSHTSDFRAHHGIGKGE